MRAELARLVDDLPAVSAEGVGVRAVRQERPVVEFTPVGSVKRSGRWRLERDVRVTTVVGSVKVDLRSAEIAAPEVRLHVKTVVGSVKVWIPRGVRVEVDGISVVGSRRISEDSGAGYEGAPVLRLRLDSVVGSVRVYRT